MIPFPKTFESVLAASEMTATQVCASSGLSKHNVSNLLAGRREIGPKTLAALLSTFKNKAHQKQLVLAYLDEMLDEVNTHTSDEEDPWTMGRLLRGEKSTTEAITPLWLEELVEEAVIAGDADPEVLMLIQDLLQAVLKFKKTRPKKEKA